MKVTPKEKITALTDALADIADYRRHEVGCQIEQTDFCTCGMKRVWEAARAAYALEVEY